MEKRIENWKQKGIIDETTALSLLQEIKQEKADKYKIRMNILIYTVAAVLLGLGIITFIASNDWLLELLNSIILLKVAIVFILTIFSLWTGTKLIEQNRLPKLGNFLIVLSSLLIGATYILIGQSYNIEANNSGLTFLWLISILPIAYLFKNYAVNVISIIMFILSMVFFYMELDFDNGLTWTIFIPIICGIFLYTAGNIPVISEKYNEFSISYKLVGLVPVFVTLMILTCSVEESYQVNSMFYYIPVFILSAVNLLFLIGNRNTKNDLIKVESAFMSALLLLLLLPVLVLETINPVIIMILVNIALILMIILGFNYGYKFENSKLIAKMNLFLIIYILVNYCRWGWSFMDKTLFFILGGLLLLFVGIALEKRRKLISKGN